MIKIIAKLPLEKWFITRKYGNVMIDDKIKKPHAGVDLRANYVPVLAPIDGETKTFTEPLGGKWIKLTNGDIQFRFAHLSEYKKTGQVKAGDVIAISGNTGSNTTGAHLHFEMWVKGNRVDPEKSMLYKIALKNWEKIPTQVFDNVQGWFAAFSINVQFYFESNPDMANYWALLDCAGFGSWADTKDTHKTPGYYDISYDAKNLAESSTPRTPEDIIVHEILHCLYEDAGLMDIHDYGWGVENNEKVIKFLIIKNKNMDYVIVGKEQFLIFEPWRLAFNIGDEVEAKALLCIPNFPQTPRPVENLNGYTQVAFIRKERLRDLFGL